MIALYKRPKEPIYDDEGRRVCEECKAHISPKVFEGHICPIWLKVLVNAKKNKIVDDDMQTFEHRRDNNDLTNV